MLDLILYIFGISIGMTIMFFGAYGVGKFEDKPFSNENRLSMIYLCVGIIISVAVFSLFYQSIIYTSECKTIFKDFLPKTKLKEFLEFK